MRILLRPINLLLLAGPIGLVSERMEWGSGLTFLLLALAIVPLAGLISGFTDVLADRVGDRIGGLLEATFGNAAFIILGILALSQGLTEVVQASIAGALIANTLFVLGLAFFVGTMRGKRQQFRAETGTNYSKLLALAVVALVLPAIAESTTPAKDMVLSKEVSIIASVVLLLLYVAYLLYDIFHLNDLEYRESHGKVLRQNPKLNAENAPIMEYRAERDQPQERLTASAARREQGHEANLSPIVAILGLVAALVATVTVSEPLVQVTESLTHGDAPIAFGAFQLGQLHLTKIFVGLVIIPLIGTAAEHLSALRSAISGRTEITVAVTAGAAIQVALLAAPIFVIASLFLSPDKPFALIFTPIELAVFALAAFLFYLVTEDGEGTWLEGVQLLAFYLIFAGVAFFLKDPK
ncbi:MAG: calcium/proton exchanger [Ktedonobacterales bacterium]|nr:calcium/proton exchanger [Ktedonobacterales bacterium]